MNNRFNEISTMELYERLDSPDVQIIDVRPIDAYNGWKLRSEKRGGHIRGARTLPAKWSEYIDWIEILRSKEIAPDHEIVVYGYNSEETDRIAGRLRKAGFDRIKVYHDFIGEWVRDEALPMDFLQRYSHLVSPHWLHELITRGKADEYSNDDYVICHSHYRNRADYTQGHIPGAVEIDTNMLESPETWNRRSPEELKTALEQRGISSETTVILYGRFSYPDNSDPYPGSSAGHLAAFRCAFIMLYAGVEDVRILNGGLQAWTDAGFETTSNESQPRAVQDFGASIPSAPELVVDLPEAKAILESPEKNLVSVRSWREYIGEVSGYNYIEKTGRIPGSLFDDCGSDAYHMENYRNLDHTTREFHEIEKSWREIGVTPDKHNAFYCGTGWRGSEAFVNAWLMGWPDISVYDGGWFEWSSDEKNPVETGIPESAAD